MSDMFGELPKRHKSDKKTDWKKRGLITDNFEEIYQRYISSTNCEKCGNEFKNRRHRCMDHCHSTGAFRNILCTGCNCRTDVKIPTTNTSGFKHICTTFDKRDNIEYWIIRIVNKGKVYKVCRAKSKHSLEEVVALRDSMYEEFGIQ